MRVSRTELAAALQIAPAGVDRLVDAGILPQRGRRGWLLAECQKRLDLAATASRFGSTPAWLKFIDDFERLAREAPAALRLAMDAPTPANAQAAAAAGNTFFADWAFVIAALDGRPSLPASLHPITFAAVFGAFAEGLAAVGQVLDDRAAARFLN